LKSLGRTLLETPIDDARERRWNVPLGDREIRWILLQDRHHRVRRRLALECAPPREHLVQHGAEGEDVGAMIGRRRADLFGRHIAECAHDGARL
jgi:hypothetical protein